MGGFFKIGGAVEFQVAYMGKMDSAFQGTDHIGQVIVQVGAVGSGAEGNTVVRVIHHFHHAEDVFLINDDSGEAEYAPGGVIRMNGHVDVVFITGGHDAFQEIFQIGKELFIVNVFIHGEEVFDFFHTLRFPAGHDAAVGICADGGKHILWIQFVHCFLGICKNGGTIRAHSGKLGSCPVKNRHEIVAYHMDIRLTQIFQRGNVVIDIHVPFRCAGFDGVVDIDAFDAGKLQACVLNFFF